MSRREEFIAMMAPLAIEIGNRYGLDPRLIISQAAQETGWGEHVAGGNLFGVKSHGQPGGQSVVTTEYVNGRPVTIRDNFRAYNSVRESMEDYANFLRTNPRYADVFRQNTFEDQAKAVAAAGYATDPNYADALISIGRNLNLAPYNAAQAAENVSYGNELGQVPPPFPVPKPDNLRGAPPLSPREHNLSTIKYNPASFADLAYPVEQAQVHPDPRIAFHPTTMDKRYAAPTAQPSRSVGFSPAKPLSRRNETRAETFMSLPSKDIAPRVSTPLTRRNETRAEQLTQKPAPRAQQANTRVAPTIQTAGFTRMPDDAFERISQEMRVANQADGLGSYPTSMALDRFNETKAPVSRRNEAAAEALMTRPASSAAPVPARAPANLRGDPLAHIVPGPTTAPVPATRPVTDPLSKTVAPLSPVSGASYMTTQPRKVATTTTGGLMGNLFNGGPVKSVNPVSIAAGVSRGPTKPTASVGPSPWNSSTKGGSGGGTVVVSGVSSRPSSTAGTSVHGRKYNFDTNRWETV